MNNDTFRNSYEKVNPDSIKAELAKYLEMPPFHQIRAFHLLHIMGLLNPSFGVQLYMKTERGSKCELNRSMDKGLVCLYILNHLSSFDWDQSSYYHDHHNEIVYSCLLSAFSKEHRKEALDNNQANVFIKHFVKASRIKSEIA